MTYSKLADRISAVPLRHGRRIIAIAGAPASGKSTLADNLARQLPHAMVVPMDGFHRDNADLDQHGLLNRKGAPETFDAEGFVRFVQRLRSPGNHTVPTFDRSRDCVIANGSEISSTAQTLLVEGNYLLLNRAPWLDLSAEWDLSIAIDVPLEVLEHRLIQRWLDHGLALEAARLRATQNDIPNARLVTEHSQSPDIRFKPQF